MAKTTTSFLRAQNNSGAENKAGIDFLRKSTASRLNNQKNQVYTPSIDTEPSNNGGFLGGLGYLGEKVAVGFMSSIEGIWDYSAGGLAKLFGADDWAEQQFENDWFGDWYSHPEEWYNPSKGWQVAGDVAGGIGTSIPSTATVLIAGGIAAASGGTLAPAAIPIISFAVGGLSAAGNSTKQAYRETGELNGEAFGYGALSGITEGSLESISSAIGTGAGQAYKAIGEAFGKQATKTIASQTFFKTLGKGFIGEAFEEGTGAFLDPIYQRMTYNQNAENASPQEIAYAAFVGGMSGMIMSGGGYGISKVVSLINGNKIASTATETEKVLNLGEYWTNFEEKNKTGIDVYSYISEKYKSLRQSLISTNGEVRTAGQKIMLDELNRATVAGTYTPLVIKEAARIAENAPAVAERMNSFGYKTPDGKPIVFTAKQLMEGIDLQNPKSISNALKTNRALLMLSTISATGHLVMDTSRFAQATLAGKKLASQVDLNRFIETATPSEISAVSQALGIEDWSTLDVDTFNQKITSFVENGGVQQYADRRATVQSIQAIPAETARPMPKMVNLRQDGSVRYSDGRTQIAITRQGDAYTVYDYASGHLSKNMTRSEVNKLLRDYNTQQADITAGARAQMEAESELRRQAEELDTYARENIADYSKLSSPNQSMIRKVIREGRARGMSDEDVLTYAKVSAHAGIDITFDKQATFRGKNEKGEEVYVDGFYDPNKNRIVVNPDSKRSHERLLLHELEHAIINEKGGKKMIATAFRSMDEDARSKIIKRYSDFYRGTGLDAAQTIDILNDEVSAHFAEEILSNRNTLEKLIEAEPTMKDKILSFFMGASEDYKSVPNLSRAARSYYKTYKKLFDEFAERNFQNNATEVQTARLSGDVSDARFSLQFADHIADNQRRFVLSNNVALAQDELERAIDQTAHMVELMSRYKDILPADTVPKKKKATLVKNGSYDISVENTTICVRTLAYNSFVEMVSEKIGRPLTQMESFLVSQKLYDIAKEPQCLYCYVSLDRKAYNDMILKYIDQRERAIEAYERAGRPDITSESHPLYQEYLAGRKATKPQWKRYTSWIEAYKNGDGFLTTQDVATESRRAELARTGTPSQKAQLKDMTDYAQNASQAKKQTDYVAYYDDILRLSAPVVRNLNKHYGLRWYSFSDYSGAFIVENMQQITDASIRGLKGLAYTKDADFVRIFAPTGMNINVSVFVKENADGTFSIDPKQSANATVDELIKLREKYPNVGVVATATSDAGVEWALAQDWTDVVIPFHIVRTGSNVADFYKWKNFTFEQSDTVADQNLWDAYVSSVAGESASARKKVSKMIYPSEHQNSRETYLRLIEERGLKPRFSSFLDNPNYMKLVNETRQSEAETVALKPVFDVKAAEAAFRKFVDKGGYYEGWYNDGIDIESEAETVAQDVLAGKKANEVSYGRQDIDAESIQKGRRGVREHGRRFAIPFDDAIDKLDNGTLDTHQTTHLKVLDHTPQIYIDKAGASDREIVMSCDIAYLAMKKSGDLNGNYHGLGADIMKAIPHALEDPLYIVKQKNGRIAAVTKIVVKGKRAVFASIELEAFKTTIQEGETESKKYNLVVTVTDAKPNYLKNTIFSGEIVHNKNREDPAHFILRLKSLEKAVPTYDPAGSSDSSISQTAKKSNTTVKNSSEISHKKRFALPETDSEGTQLTEAQQEFFKDSKVRDSKGRLLVMYHGTTASFNTFKKGDVGFHFGTKAAARGRVGYGKNAIMKRVHLNITNPIVFKEDLGSWDADFRLTQELFERKILTREDVEHVLLSDDRSYRRPTEKANRKLAEILLQKGYDGIAYSNTFETKKPTTSYIVFQSNQAKVVENEAPTSNPDIRYALAPVPPVEPTSHDWKRTIDTEEAKKRFPSLWDVSAEESETRNPTQIRSTVSTYRKIYDILKSEGFEGKILDASSGLGYGTRAGIEEYGFNVDDIEPYPDRSYSPKYTDYSALTGKYDVIISNAVLNVLPQDQRDALVVKMGELLSDGGRIFVNVRGDDVNTLSSNPSNVKIGNMEWFVSSTGSYQKGFTSNELIAYLKDALGADFKVQGTSRFGKTSAIVTKKSDSRFAIDLDSEYMSAVESGDTEKARQMVDKAARAAGYKLHAYHGTNAEFTVFDTGKQGQGVDQFGAGFYFANNSDVSERYGNRMIESYLKLEKPIRILRKGERGNLFDVHITKAQAYQVLKRHPLMYDPEESPLGDFYEEYWETGAKDWMIKDLAGKYTSIGLLDGDQILFKNYPNELHEALREVCGFDGVQIHFETDAMVDERNDEYYVTWFPEQAKSADPVAYDGDGKVIPLSKRFDANDADIRYALSETRGSIMTEVDPEYKPTVKDKVFSGWTAFQIAFTNAQAGIETVGKKYGVRNIESLVQAARSGRNQAEEMIAGNQYRIGADTKTYQGEGLEAIFRPISRQGEEVKGDFFDYLFNYHNMSRMTLEQRSMAEQQNRLGDLKKKVTALKRLNKRIEKLQEQIKDLGRTKKDMDTKRGIREELTRAKAEAKTLKKEATELEKAAKAFVPLENKPVLGTTGEHGIETVVTAEQSEAIVKKYEEAHPEFKGVAEKVWAFLQNLNQYRVDTGLISQDTFDYLAKLYPHYVPTYRTGATKGIGAIEGKYNLKVKTTIKTAKGSTKNLLPPDVMIARQVMETVRAGRINQLANALYEGAQKSGDTTYIEIVSRERMSDEAIADLDPTELRPKNNEVVFFRDGERITMRVSKEIFAGFNAFNPEVEIHNPLVNGARAINNGFKRLVTSLNPAFLLRNTIRDVQDAGINTRYGKTFLKNYARATYEISHNGKLWQLYKAMGGFSSSVFDFEKGFSGMQNKWGLTKAEGNLLMKTLQGVENANAFVEQLPRLAEFISSIEAGNTAEQAILDSADVTTNFARMGNITKVLNRTLIPFLNPSIQGCSKMIRNITSIRSAREFASLVLRAVLVGVAPMVLNMLMYEDDEDYKNLRDADKENNFLFKVGDTFVKIPRGRVASVIGGLVNRSKTALEGEDADWAGYVKNIMQQVTPVDSMSRTIFSPFSDVANNITWYGSAIEGRQFENTAPRERFDENTSVIAKAVSEFLYTIGIGKAMEVSPKKVHYLLDQYSGVIGDFILPATTAKAEKDFLSGNFTLDPATSNRLSTDFYEMCDQAQYAKTAGDDTAAYQVRYLNKVKSAISDMYKQKSEIQNNPDLSNAEKLQQTRVVQLLINEAYKTALQDFELYTKAIEATAGMEDENLRFTEATRLMFGAERALSEYNDDVYAKCQILNKAGVDYEVLYRYYFTVRGITSDKDYEGNTISGSKRKKVVASINGMNISVDQKLLLICASGYALQDNDLPRMTAVSAKKRLLRYILNLKGATQTEKIELAEMCGFEVKNGRIVTKTAFSIG